jgi:hypothetical protein
MDDALEQARDAACISNEEWKIAAEIARMTLLWSSL